MQITPVAMAQGIKRRAAGRVEDAEYETCHTEAQRSIFRGIHCWTKSGQIVSKKGNVCKLCRVRRGQGGRERGGEAAVHLSCDAVKVVPVVILVMTIRAWKTEEDATDL